LNTLLEEENTKILSNGNQGEILCVNTGGVGDLHGLRMRRLAAYLGEPVTLYDLDRDARKAAFKDLNSLIQSRPWKLIYQESTGIAGGLNMILAARKRGQRYIFSSGDPVEGFFRTTKGEAFGRAFGVYERQLFKYCAGFIGWTPYLTGRAIELGAKRTVTIEGAVDLRLFQRLSENERREIKNSYGISPDDMVCGVVGSLKWTERQSYCYGLELVEAARRVKRKDVSFLIVGDGDGKARLQERVPEALRHKIIFTGRVPEKEVARAMNAMDIGFITQTLDSLGSYRLTTKMPEYLASGLPIAMSPIPGYFDYVGKAGWPLPPLHPASSRFYEELALWIDTLTWEEIQERQKYCASAAAAFDYEVVGPRFASFVHNILNGTS
jgi:glycosyltransferase involved in cell wall biosynthesis